MANTLVQFRIEESTRESANRICEKIGIDIPTYMRMCLSRLVQENGIPFSMKIDSLETNAGYHAMKEASRIAQEYGVANMTLDEINAEISEARK